MTDNAWVFRSLPFMAVCRRWHLRHIYIKAYTPQTNGKAERFIQTRCASGPMDDDIGIRAERKAYLAEWLHRYNWHRPHSALAGHPPITRLGVGGDNLLRLHT